MEVKRDKRPETGSAIKFSLPRHIKHSLKNGVEIYLVKKTDLPIARINLIINSGSKFDPKSKYGLSNLTAMCIDEGAGELDALQLSDEFDYLGAHFSVHSDSDITILSLQTLSENFNTALNLLSSVILSPHFKESDFLREKRKVQTRIEQLKDEPDYIANSAFELFLFGKQNPYAYPVIGIRDALNGIEISDVIEFYKSFLNPQNTSIVAVGNFEDEKIIPRIESTFQDWINGNNFSMEFPTERKKDHKIYVIHKQDSVQTEIRIGHLSEIRNDKDYFQKQLLNLIFGGQFSSRLNLNLREKHGYTYGISSRFNYFKNDAYFSVSTSVNTENTLGAIDEILNELRKVREGITEEELAFAKLSISRRFPLNFETYSQIASNFSSKIIHNLADDYFETFLSKILNVEIEDVNTVAAKSIVPDSALIVLCGDEKKIMGQINKLSFGEVVVVNYDQMYSD
jgi:zinc protease